jgi:hypothetical protein
MAFALPLFRWRKVSIVEQFPHSSTAMGDKDWGSGERLEATYVERVFLEMVYYQESRKSRARSSKSIYPDQ